LTDSGSTIQTRFNKLAQDLDDGKGVVAALTRVRSGIRRAVTRYGLRHGDNADGEVTNVICNDTGREEGRSAVPCGEVRGSLAATDYQMVSIVALYS